MKVTVLIATRNRGEQLRHTLQSLLCEANLELPDWEVVVVFDDVAKDGTREVCEAFRSKYRERFRALAQRKEGKSNALNLGIGVARGEVLALTDDDVICDPAYITSVQKVFEQYSVDAAQGRILPDCEGRLPDWMSETLRSSMSVSDCGDEIRIPFKRSLFGTNMAVRTDVARAIGGFAPELGAGSPVGFCEDTEFSLRLRHAGYRIMYAPQIMVCHHLPRRRLTKSFFRKRMFRVGRSRAYYSPYEAPLWRYGLYTMKSCVLREAKGTWCQWTGNRAEAIDCQCEARLQAGFFWQHCLFYFGVPRRLTRINSWPEQAGESQEGANQLQEMTHSDRVQASRR